MFEVGDKIRLNDEGRRLIEGLYRKTPKALFFFTGTHTVIQLSRDFNGEQTAGSKFPEDLDIEPSVNIEPDRVFFIPEKYLRKVGVDRVHRGR